MKRDAGFSLIELLIVMAILLVLAAVAYPNYAGYITKTRRIEGQIALIEAIQQQERFYTRNNTYIAFSSGSTDAEERRFKWWSGSTAATSAYELRARACPGRDLAECVEVQALPGTAMVNAKFKDTDCETLTVDSAGAQKSSGPLQHCWP